MVSPLPCDGAAVLSTNERLPLEARSTNCQDGGATTVQRALRQNGDEFGPEWSDPAAPHRYELVLCGVGHEMAKFGRETLCTLGPI